MIQFNLLHPFMTEDYLGLIPHFLSEDDPAPAREQFDRNYRFGGGWNPFPGFRLGKDDSLSYPGDPVMKPVARARLRDEVIVFYPHSWVAVIQPDRSFEVSRVD